MPKISPMYFARSPSSILSATPFMPAACFAMTGDEFFMPANRDNPCLQRTVTLASCHIALMIPLRSNLVSRERLASRRARFSRMIDFQPRSYTCIYRLLACQAFRRQASSMSGDENATESRAARRRKSACVDAGWRRSHSLHSAAVHGGLIFSYGTSLYIQLVRFSNESFWPWIRSCR